MSANANTAEIIAVWDGTTGFTRSIDPDTREPFTLETANAYAATLLDSEVLKSVNGSPYYALAYPPLGPLASFLHRAAGLARRLGARRLIALAVLLAVATVPMVVLVAASASRPLNVGMYRGTDHGTQVCVHVVRHLGFGHPECKAWADAR